MSVYGKKIVIDGVEYVAQKDTDTLDCSGCYFQKKHCANIEEKLKKVFGNDCAKGRYILKKVTPKKKQKTPTNFEGLQRRIEGHPYLNPLDMMYGGEVILIDNKPCKIIDVAGESGYDGIKHIITFQQINEQSEKIKLAKVEATRGTTPTETLMAGKRSDSTAKEMASILMATSNIIKHSPFKEADKFIVCLSEADGLKPSDVPKQHYSEADAIKEAERLCKKHNQKFVVLKVVAEVSPMICPVTTKRG